MNLKNILMMMPDNVLNVIEGIEYLDGPDDFQISITTRDNDGYTQVSKIHLWSDGETNLIVGSIWDTDYNESSPGIVFDETIEIYSTIKGIWQKNIV